MPTSYKIITLAIALAFSSTAMAKVYKWTDANGKTHYTATPPPAKTKAKAEEFKVRKKPKSSLRVIPASESTVVYAETKTKKKRKTTHKKKKNKPVNYNGTAASKCKTALGKIDMGSDKRSLTECIQDYGSDSNARSKINAMNSSTYDAAYDKELMKRLNALKSSLNK